MRWLGRLTALARSRRRMASTRTGMSCAPKSKAQIRRKTGRRRSARKNESMFPPGERNKCTRRRCNWVGPKSESPSLQGLQELNDGFLVGAFQSLKLQGDVAGFAAVARDGFEKR